MEEKKEALDVDGLETGPIAPCGCYLRDDGSLYRACGNHIEDAIEEQKAEDTYMKLQGE